ncbi:ABC transporter permease subunit [Natronorubrum sp. JWXQ-INN-674]|uniref:ABC transporter permease subunit n=1 Tax=Natronorubrum halalkaliphilum TaxID=2691917 RepID=A0A6B0VGX4_9EURY|nr:ABC transporter permease [Natronorubrum halalkaliphilum]MXV60798.1 ABC transporter permease subunit [Natronorubrum halalkaliphilum]
MNFVRIVAKRVALGLVAAWAVLTVVFAVFTMSDDWIEQTIEGAMRFQGANEAEIERSIEEYLATHGFDRPLYELYFDWMGNMLTFQWGEAFFLEADRGSGAGFYGTGDPVFPMVADAVLRTGMYVLPAIVLAIVAGVLIGLYAAMNPQSRLAGSGMSMAYLLFAVPNFWIGGMLLSYAAGGVIPDSTLLFEHILPITLTATTLLGGYVAYSRAHSIEYASADFVTLVKAKGANRIRIATHIVRNSAIPLFSMLFTEALALLVLAVFVIESLFQLDGFGSLLFNAVHMRDLPVVLGCTLVIIAVGILGNIVQDLAYSSLDPRVDTGSR